MKIKKSVFILVLMFFVLSSSVVHAAGIGFYAGAGAGNADWSSNDYLNTYPKFKSDTEHLSAGLAFDTHVSGDRLFNYHMNIGYERLTAKDIWVQADYSYDPSIKNPAPIKTDAEMKGFVMNHTFGFGGGLMPGTRFWMGPELRLQWAKGSPDKAPNVDIRMFGVGIGPAVGFNMNLRGGLTVVLKAGYQFVTLGADIDGYTPAKGYVSQSFDVDEKFFYINVELLARTTRDR